MEKGSLGSGNRFSYPKGSKNLEEEKNASAFFERTAGLPLTFG
jgi:hypothetical protein